MTHTYHIASSQISTALFVGAHSARRVPGKSFPRPTPTLPPPLRFYSTPTQLGVRAAPAAHTSPSSLPHHPTRASQIFMSYAVNSAKVVRAKTSTGLFGIHHIMAVRSKGLESGGKRQPCLGSWIMMPGHNITRMTANMGYDWILIDCEHGNFSDATMHESIAIIASQPGCSPWVRLPDAQNWMVKRALDAGAHGLLVPFMNSAEEARKFVSYTKFPVPKANGGGGGVRGIGSPFSPNLFGQTMGEYFQSANKDIFVAVQIESREGVNNCEEIAEVEGVDAILIGPNDLASQLGYIATDHESIPEVQQAIERVLKACKKANKYCGMFCTSPEGVRRHFDQGFDFMNLGGDWVALGEWNAKARGALADLM